MKYLKILSLVFCTLFFAVNCKAHAGVKQIETKYNVKIGVYAIDTNNGNSFSYRQDERFPFQSTVKMVVAAAALKKIEADERIKISSDDIVFWSPIVRLNLDRGYMTIKELADKKDNAQQADKAIAETTKFILDEFSKKNTCFAATDFK